MRHQKHTFKVGRTPAHRGSMIANMLKSLLEDKNHRISTTVAKAKELKRHADKLITIAKKENKLAARREAISTLKTDDMTHVQTLFGPLVERYTERKGGYTRIVRTFDRKGDSAPICFIEYVL